MAEPSASLTIVVPCFNEEANIQEAVRDLSVAFASFRLPWEILVVDDCSTDASETILRQMNQPFLRVVRHPENRGLGAAYRTGVERSRMTHVMLFPGDNEINAQSVREVCDHIGAADIILPYAQNPEIRTLTRRLVSKVYTILINIICLHWIRYYNGPVVQSKRLLSQVGLKTNSFAYQAEVVVQLLRLGYRFVEVPFRLNYRSGRTRAFNMNNFLMIGKTLGQLARLYWLPVKQTPPVSQATEPTEWPTTHEVTLGADSES